MSTESPPNKSSSKAEANQPVLRPHSFDGIQEFDQHLPNWWLATLYIAILWAVFSWIWDFQVSRPLHIETTDAQRVEQGVAAVKQKQAANMSNLLSTLNDEKFWTMSKDAEMIARGQVTFDTICSACHAKDLTATMPGGVKLPGLALHDTEWKFGGNPMDIFKIVSKGSPDPAKGMIAWEPQLGGVKVAEVVAYMLSKHQPGKWTLAPDAPPDAPKPSASSGPPSQ